LNSKDPPPVEFLEGPPAIPLADPDSSSAPITTGRSTPEALESTLATLRPGSQIRVRLADGSILEGTFLLGEDGALRFDDADTTAATVAQIDSLWEQRISKRKGQIKGAVTTGAILATGGALFFLAAAAGAAAFSEDAPQGAEWVAIGLVGFGVGGLVGCGLGTLLGTVFSHGDLVWVQRYPEVRTKRSAWASPPPVSP
jgi:hypothetical protein